MSDVKVLFKKNCGHAQPDDMTSVKQLMIIEADGERRLTVKLFNARAETVTRVTLVVTELDENGRIIGKSRHTLDVNGAPNKAFVPERCIVLDDRACDCNVVAESARYGAYEYRATKNGATAAYVGDAVERAAVGKFADKAGKDGIAVKRRKLKAPILVTLALIVSVALCVIAVYAHLLYFVRTEKTFLYNGVEYAFENDDRSDGSDIYVVGYYGARARVVIPDKIEGHTVTRVEKGAFKNNRSLVSVAFKSEMPIGDSAFENCSALKTVEFDNITEIGASAFKGCSMLRSVKITDKISEIPQYAFDGCTELAEVIVEACGTPVKIGRYAFAQCKGLKNVDFARRIDFSGDEREFFFRSKIERLHLVEFDTAAPDGKASIASLFGGGVGDEFALGELSVDHMPTIPREFAANISSLKSFEVSHTDTSEIGDFAFYGCSALKEFLYPVAVTKVGESAFSGTAVKVFDGASIASLGSYAFSDCASLELVNLSGNTALTELPAGVFMNCTALSRVNVPVNVTRIYPSAFKNCASLSSVKYADGGSIDKICDEAFRGCKSLTAFVAPHGLKELGKYAFADCIGITEFTVPDGVTFVDIGVLSGCVGLKSFTAPFIGESVDNSDRGYLGYTFAAGSASVGVTYVPESLKKVVVTRARRIHANAFRSLKNIDEIVLPSVLTSIGESAFYECKDLTDIDMPLGLREIDAQAFGRCERLTELTVPSTVTSVGAGAFADCVSLKKLSMPYATSGSFGELFCAETHESSFSYVPSALKTVELTAGVRLPENAFFNCAELESIELYEQTTEIGNYAFSGCAKLKSLEIPQSVRSIGNGILIGTNALKTLVTPFVGAERFNGGSGPIEQDRYALNNFYSYVQGGYTFPRRSIEKIVLTDSAHIAPHAFIAVEHLKRIVLECDVLSIGNYAFGECHKLYEVFNYGSLNIAAGSAANGGIAANALAVHVSRDEPALPQTTLDGNEFVCAAVDGRGKWYLTDCIIDDWSDRDLSLPLTFSYNGQTVAEYSLWQYLFSDSRIESAFIPASVAEIGNNAFMYCTYLERVAFAASSPVKVIPDHAFFGCYNLFDARMPDGLTEIGDQAFSGCGRLKRFTVPPSMRRIGAYAFNGCNRLFEIYNRSEIDIRAGQYDLGAIALNARRVYSRDEIARDPDIALPNVTVDGVQYIKLGDGGKDWWAVDYYGLDGVLELKPFDYNGKNGVERVTRIGVYDEAFANATGVYKLVVGNVLDRVEQDYFSNCFNLTEIRFSDNGGAYDEIEICDYAFSQRAWNPLTVVADTAISSIGKRAFYYDNALTLQFDKRVGVIKANAFYTVNENAPLTAQFADIGEICSQAFDGNSGLYSIKAGDVDVISESAFSYGDRLVSAEFGVVGTVGEGAFSQCPRLKSVAFAAVDTIGDFAFRSCSALADATLGNGDGLSIGDRAFADCISLREFEYAGHIADIGEYAFNNDSALMRLSLGGVDSIGERAFASCFELGKVTFTGNVGSVGAGAFNTSGVTELRFGGNVGTIGRAAFANCFDLRSVDFGGSLAALGNGVFSLCSLLKTITLPDSLTAIPENAFSDCVSLREVALPKNLRTLDRTAFSSCKNVLVVYAPCGLDVSGDAYFDAPIAIVKSETDAAVQYRTQNGMEFARIRGKWYHISGWSTSAGYIVLPASLNAGGVTVDEMRIGKYVVDAGRSVVVGKGIVEISHKAFGENTTVYFDGTAAEWSSVYKGSSVIKTYYRADCLHGDGDRYWRVGDDGSPTRDDTVLDSGLWQTTVEPTCMKNGEQTAVCPHCNIRLTRVLGMVAHNVENGKCTMCEKTATVVDSSNIGSMSGVTVVNDAVNAFAVGADGSIRSTNKSGNSSSRLTLRFGVKADVQFSYGVSSEDRCDIFGITLNGKYIDSISGEMYGLFMRLSVDVGDELVFTYTKDANISSGNDCGFIDHLTVV